MFPQACVCSHVCVGGGRGVGYLWSQVPSWSQTHVLSGVGYGIQEVGYTYYTPSHPGVEATAAVGTHPTGILSCLLKFSL